MRTIQTAIDLSYFCCLAFFYFYFLLFLVVHISFFSFSHSMISVWWCSALCFFACRIYFDLNRLMLFFILFVVVVNSWQYFISFVLSIFFHLFLYLCSDIIEKMSPSIVHTIKQKRNKTKKKKMKYTICFCECICARLCCLLSY